jgi:threonine dehydratase
VLTSRALDEAVGATLFLKAENLQRSGAFKIRGATNAVAILGARGVRHVATYSSGNHGQALALAAAEAGMLCTVLMPTDAPEGKSAATRGYGAKIVTYDRYTQDRRALAEQLASDTGATIVPPFDDAAIVAGQGTAVLELLEDVGDLDVVVTPIGGGGLLAGSCLAAAGRVTRLVGVEPDARRAARDALAAGHQVEVPVVRTICDGQQTERVGEIPLAVLLQHRAEVVGVTDDEVVAAMRFLLHRGKVLVEPSGAAGLAAALTGRLGRVAGLRIGVVLSGGNVDVSRLTGLL